MKTKHPIQYEIRPKAIAQGTQWVNLALKNVGSERLSDLDVKLNSLDTYCVMVRGMGTFLHGLAPEEEAELPFQVSAQGTGDVYATLDGERDGQPFHWESPGISLQVGAQPAELVSFLALTEPHVLLGEPITCEIVVRGLMSSVNLVLEFWADFPSGELKSLAKEGLGTLNEGQEKRYTFEITPREEGIYILHAYLYQVNRRIDHQIEYLNVSL